MKSNYDKLPHIEIHGHHCYAGFEEIFEQLKTGFPEKNKKILVIDTYLGVPHDLWTEKTKSLLPGSQVYNTSEALKDEAEIFTMLHPVVTDDRIFGKMNDFGMKDFFDPRKLEALREKIHSASGEWLVVFGEGASYVTRGDKHVLIDLARWEIQTRMKRNEAGNLGMTNTGQEFALKYKQAFFVDWRVLDQHKTRYWADFDWFIDANISETPKMVSKTTLEHALTRSVSRPFRVVPFFDPGPWGGQWMKEKFDLDKDVINFAWAFDCVPEENSLQFKLGDTLFEIPSLNLVFQRPEELLGDYIYQTFGAEFPIRFDFLDTMDGGNLSLQVHPHKAYIKEHFGMPYTQDESYYLMEVANDAVVYLGTKNGIDQDAMIHDLKQAQEGGTGFDADKYVNKFPVKKHDHVLIPAGTIHCSGYNSVVLEISATPYIFTFKLWDWDRLGLDGKPRPINIEHGENVIEWNRDKDFVRKELINRFEKIAEGPGWREESTGLHELEFIETRRHWFTGKVLHDTDGNLNVLNLVEGDEAVVESPTGAFEPFKVHYAETFIVPAHVGPYSIRPAGTSEGKECATIKAYVRKNSIKI